MGYREIISFKSTLGASLGKVGSLSRSLPFEGVKAFLAIGFMYVKPAYSLGFSILARTFFAFSYST